MLDVLLIIAIYKVIYFVKLSDLLFCKNFEILHQAVLPIKLLQDLLYSVCSLSVAAFVHFLLLVKLERSLYDFISIVSDIM